MPPFLALLALLAVLAGCSTEDAPLSPTPSTRTGPADITFTSNELGINQITENKQHHPRVETNINRTWSVVWTSHVNGADVRRIAGRYYQGLTGTPERTFVSTPAQPHHAKLAGADGVWWMSWQETDRGDVYLGTVEAGAITDEVSVKEVAGAKFIDQTAMARSSDGTIAMVWYEEADDGSAWQYQGRRFTDDLEPLGDVFTIERGPAHTQGSPLSITAIGDDRFAVAYSVSNAGGAGSGGSIHVKRVVAGVVDNTSLVVEQDADREATRPRLAAHPSGRLAVAWRASDGTRFWTRYAMVDTSSLSLVKPPRSIDAASADRPAIAAAGDYFAMSWEAPGADETEIYLQVFGFADGRVVSPVTQVNDWTPGLQGRCDLAVTETGSGIAGVVVWESNDQDGDKRGVFGRTFTW